MSFVKSFDGNEIDVGNCMGCHIVHNFNNPKVCPGQVVKTKHFTIAQDFELPINGFIVISSIRHIGSINEMTKEEKQELLTLIDIVIDCLKRLKVCPQYNVVWEEKDNNHFHVWLVPRHKYLLDAIGSNFMKKLGELFNYAKTNLRTKENIKAINDTLKKLKEQLLANKEIQDVIL